MGQFQQSIGDAVKILVNAHQSNIDKKAHDDEMQLRKDQMDQQQSQFEAQQKANDNLYKLQHAQLESQQSQQDLANAATFQRTGIAPPNTEVIKGLGQTAGVQPTNVQLGPGGEGISTSQAPPAGPLVMSGLENSQLVSPHGNVNAVPPLASSPEQQLIQRQTQEANAEKQREFLRTNEAKIQESQADMANRLILLGKENDNAKERLKLQHEGAMKLENLKGGFQLAGDRIRASLALKGMESEINPDILHGGAIGAVSQEDLRAKYGMQAAGIYNSQAAQQGYQFLPKAKVDQLDKISQMIQVLPKIESMITTQAMNPWDVNNPMSDAGIKYEGLRKDVRAASPAASVALTGVRRFSQPELERFDDYFLPNKNPLTTAVTSNLDKYNSFQNDLRLAIQNVTKGVGPKQKQAIGDYLKSLGFDPTGKLESQQPRPSDKGNKVNLNEWKFNPKGELTLGGQ